MPGAGVLHRDCLCRFRRHGGKLEETDGKKNIVPNAFSRLRAWWDKDRRILTLKAGLLALLPLLCCIAACAAQGAACPRSTCPLQSGTMNSFIINRWREFCPMAIPRGISGSTKAMR